MSEEKDDQKTIKVYNSITPKRAGMSLTENAQSDTFKAPCCCFEYVPYTALAIV